MPEFTINLSEKDIETIRKLSQEENITPTEVVQRAIEQKNYLVQEVKQGHRVVVDKPSK